MIDRSYKFNCEIGELIFNSDVRVGEGRCTLRSKSRKDPATELSGRIDLQATKEITAFIREVVATVAEPSPFKYGVPVIKGELPPRPGNDYIIKLAPSGNNWHLQIWANGGHLETWFLSKQLDELIDFLADLGRALDGTGPTGAELDGEHILPEHRTRISALGSDE